MSLQLHKKSILKKSFQFSFFTFLSRVLGFIREYYQLRLMGISALSDAFLAAYSIPLSLRKVFAEGALTSAFVPVFVKLFKAKKDKEANELMSLGFIFFQGFILLLTLLVWMFPEVVIRLIASGFNDNQMLPAIKFLRILFPFIFFISSAALLMGALQAVNKFALAAFSPVLLNIFFISSLVLCLRKGLPLEYLCFGILLGGFTNLLLCIYSYFRSGFGLGLPSKESYKKFLSVLAKFANCLFGVGIMEINMLIDRNIGSRLAEGSISLLYYGTRFMQIPLAIIAISFSTVLLAHLSRVALYAPKRMSIYLLESSKFVVWAVLPVTLFLVFTADKLFLAIMRKSVSPDKISIAVELLIIMACGLLFFSVNKILTSVFYSLGDTFSPALCSGIGTFVNLIGNLFSLFFLGKNAIYGIAASTVLFGVITTFSSFIMLRYKYNYKFYFANFMNFLLRYSLQVLCAAVLFRGLYWLMFNFAATTRYHYFFEFMWGYWLIVLPLAFLIGSLLYQTKKLFGISIYFLNK